MRIYFKSYLQSILIITGILSVSPAAGKEPVLESLAIISSGGEPVTYQVEIARTPDQMRRGLMFRDTMAENHGMLFIYSPDRPATMWMKNTILSLDMIFIDGNGTIVNIARDTVPFSLERISSGQAVKGVLEINAGQADKHGIEVGDKVSHPEFN